MSTCRFLGIYPEYIEDAGDSLDNLMDHLGFTKKEQDAIWLDIDRNEIPLYLVRANGITNAIITAIFAGGISGMLQYRKYLDPDDFDYFVNGMDTHLYYKQEEY